MIYVYVYSFFIEIFSHFHSFACSADDSESLKIVGTLADSCPSTPQTPISSSNPFEFDIGWVFGTGDVTTETITVGACSIDKINGVDGRVKNVRDALEADLGTELYNSVIKEVGLVGTSSLFIAFDPEVSKIELTQNNTVNPFGLRNSIQKKRAFQFATGLTEVSAELALGGSADIAAKVGPIEAEASIDAGITGTLVLSAGSKGVLLPVNEWLSKMKNITLPENAGFGTAKVTLDGSFDVIASALGFEVSTTGRLAKPFVLDLMNRTAISTQKPQVILDIDLPNIGDLRNLSFKDVIKLLQVRAQVHLCL
jgi:hypothetical protein